MSIAPGQGAARAPTADAELVPGPARRVAPALPGRQAVSVLTAATARRVVRKRCSAGFVVSSIARS